MKWKRFSAAAAAVRTRAAYLQCENVGRTHSCPWLTCFANLSTVKPCSVSFISLICGRHLDPCRARPFASSPGERY
jgi:hypothetical protein